MVAVVRYYVLVMTKEQQRTLIERTISSGFVILAFALFKPFGMGQLGGAIYLHLAILWVAGIGVCYLTEAVLSHLLHRPYTWDRGVDYFIRRNLLFQFLNTPLIALMFCLYFHYVAALSPDPLTWTGYLKVLLAIALCVLGIGFYWRFKYRNRYLAAELKEVKALNERLERMNAARDEGIGIGDTAQTITLTGSTSDSVTLQVEDLLYIESVGNYVKVCYMKDGTPQTDILRATSKQMEEALKEYPMVVRCHRAYIANLAQAEKVLGQSESLQLQMRHIGTTIPVSRSHAAFIKATF